MRVVENNNTIAVTCTRCHSKLAVEESDISFNDIAVEAFTVTCGACGKTTPVPQKIIPGDWLRRIAHE